MSYNLKNASIIRKSASKTPKWPSLKLLAFKSKFIRQHEFLENLEDLYEKRRCSSNFFHTNLLILQKFTVFNDGGLKFGHYGILDALFPFLAFFKL